MVALCFLQVALHTPLRLAVGMAPKRPPLTPPAGKTKAAGAPESSRKLQESCAQSKGFSCGRAYMLLRQCLMLPLTIPWTLGSAIFHPYRHRPCTITAIWRNNQPLFRVMCTYCAAGFSRGYA